MRLLIRFLVARGQVARPNGYENGTQKHPTLYKGGPHTRRQRKILAVRDLLGAPVPLYSRSSAIVGKTLKKYKTTSFFRRHGMVFRLFVRWSTRAGFCRCVVNGATHPSLLRQGRKGEKRGIKGMDLQVCFYNNSSAKRHTPA